MSRQVGDGFDPQGLRQGRRHGHGIAVVEPQRCAKSQAPLRQRPVQLLAGQSRLLEDGLGQGARIFRIKIDLTFPQRLVHHQRAPEAVFALYGKALRFQELGDDFRQQVTLGKGLGGDDHLCGGVFNRGGLFSG